MMLRKIALIGLIVMMTLPGALMAVVHDYASSVNSQHGNASPSTSASNVNDYTSQDEQINLDVNSGVVKVLRTDQKVNVNKYVTDLVQFRNANPRELRHVFRTITRKEGGNSDVLQDKVKKEYFLHVVCPEFQLPYLKAAAEALDVSWIKVADEGNCDFYYKAKFRPIDDILWISKYYRSGEGTFNIDSSANAMYFNDVEACSGLQSWGLKQIDIPPNQVLLEITAYEVNTQNDMKIGLDWIDWKNGPGRNLFDFVFSSIQGEYQSKWFEDVDRFGDIVGRYKESFGGSYNYMSIYAMVTAEFVDFLQVKGKARELTRKTLLVQSGHKARSQCIDQVVNINAVDDGAYNFDGDNIHRDPDIDYDEIGYELIATGVRNLPETYDRYLEFIQSGNVGVEVEVTPFIGLESMEMDVDIFCSSITGIDANGLPVIDERSVCTKVRLVDGEPFVIGGLKRTSSVKRSAKVPILGSIPVLGWLFGNETNINRQNDVVIVIKPKFMLGTDSDYEMPEEAKTCIAQATGEEMLPIPKSKWGFDQWLLDGDR